MRRVTLFAWLAMILAPFGACNSMHNSVLAEGRQIPEVQEPAPNQHETPIQSVNGKVVVISSTQLTLTVQADGQVRRYGFRD